MILYLILWLAAALLAGALGLEKRIGFWGAYFSSIFFSPIAGLLLTFLSPKIRVVNTAYQNSLPYRYRLGETAENSGIFTLVEEGLYEVNNIE